MALQTKTYNSAKTSRNYSLRLTLTENSTDVTNNTSNIGYKLELLSEGWNFSQYAVGYTVTINGTKVAEYLRSNGTQISMGKNSSYKLCEGTTNVEHGSDGTKTITAANIGATLDMPLADAGPGAITLSADSSWTLTTIARKSTLTVGNGTLGSSQNITVNTASADFKHTLTYTCGSTSGTLFTKQAASAMTSMTLNTSLASQNTSGTKVNVSLTLTTYTSDGNTSLGSNSYSIQMTIPDNSTTKPSISTISKSEANGRSIYLQSVSALSVSFTVSGYQGATIASHSLQIKSGDTVLVTYSGTGANFSKNPTDVIGTYGTITLLASATDSRGFTNTKSTTVTYTRYTVPSISNVSLYRTNNSGTATSSGAYGTIKFTASVSTYVSGNTMTCKAWTRAGTSGDYTSANITTSGTSVTNQTYTFSASTSSSHFAYVTVADNYFTTTSVVVTMGSEAVYMKIDPAHNALSIGTVESESNSLRVAWNSVFNNKIEVYGKYNTITYSPYSWTATDTDTSRTGYLRIATILITGTYLNQTIDLEVIRRYDITPIHIYTNFTVANTNDPSLAAFYYFAPGGLTNNRCRAFIVKTATSTWDIYMEKNTGAEQISVNVITGSFAQGKCNITYATAYQSSILSGGVSAAPVPAFKPTVTLTKSSGVATASVVNFYRQGALCILTFKVTNGSSDVAAGTDVWVGTYDGPTPMVYTSACAYSGASCLIARIDTSNSINVRVTGTTWPATYDTSRFTLVYFSVY